MDADANEIFQRYARHYEAMSGGIERLPDDLERLKRDRLPPWIGEMDLAARILDAGCAQGDLLAALSRVGFTDLTGVDLSGELLERARARLPASVRLIQADVRDYLLNMSNASFDLIFFHDVLEHLPRQDTIPVLRQFRRLLAPEGRLSVRVPNMSALIGGYCAALDFTHITHFTEYSLMQVFEAAGFDVQKIALQRQAPRLFWSWRRPHRSMLRLLNRCRWHANNGLHRLIYRLADMRPLPTVFDPNLVIVART